MCIAVIPIRVKNDNCVGIVFGSWPYSNVLSSSPYPCRLVLLSNASWNKVVGWAFGERMTSDLMIAALNMALHTRRPESVIHHNDQGSQYTSIAFGKRCEEMGVKPSMGTVGDAYDNAMAESFFATLECELIDRRSWKTKAEAKTAIFTWVEAWYNPHRRHSGLGTAHLITLKGA